MGRQEATVVNMLALTIGSTTLMPNCIVPWDPNMFVDMLILKDIEAISSKYCCHSNTVLIFKETGLMSQHLSAGIGQQVKPAEGEAYTPKRGAAEKATWTPEHKLGHDAGFTSLTLHQHQFLCTLMSGGQEKPKRLNKEGGLRTEQVAQSRDHASPTRTLSLQSVSTLR